MTELREWIEKWCQVPDDWHVGENELTVAFGTSSPRLTFRGRAPSQWCAGDLPVHRDLRLVPHCGVELPGYAEYLVDLDHIGQ